MDETDNSAAYILVLHSTKGTLGHTVKSFSPAGTVEHVLGTAGKAGSGLAPLQFDQVADLAISSSGEIFIVDGDGGMNNRLIKLQQGYI